MAQDQIEAKRKDLVGALMRARPHYDWVVRFDRTPTEQGGVDATMFVAAQNDAGKTWQVPIPWERLEGESIAGIVEEIIEGMDDELSG